MKQENLDNPWTHEGEIFPSFSGGSYRACDDPVLPWDKPGIPDR